MWRKILQNWREIVGWVVIVWLAVRLINFGNFNYADSYRTNEQATFEALAIWATLVLVWLWINRKSD